MPLKTIIRRDHGLVALWEITEPEEEILKSVTAADRAGAAQISNRDNRLQHFASRAALQAIAPGAAITYDAAGRPVLTETCDRFPASQYNFVTISHTRGLAAAVVSSRPCGIDVESLERNLDKISSRFVSPSEAELPTIPTVGVPLLVWCAKETMFKMNSMAGIDFLNDMQVLAITPESRAQGTINCLFRGQQQQVEYFVTDNFLVVFCI